MTDIAQSPTTTEQKVRSVKMKRPWILGVLVLAGLAVVGVVWWYSPMFELPAPTGPHRVGVKAFALVDESRHGLLGTPASEPRRIPIRVWYPASDEAQGPTRPYLEGYEATSFGENLGEGPVLDRKSVV